MLSTPPGFAEGMNFPKKSLAGLLKSTHNPSLLKLSDVLAESDLQFDLGGEDEEEEELKEVKAITQQVCLVFSG